MAAQPEYSFRDLIDALPAPIYITDAEGCVTHCNPAAVQFFGRAPESGTDRWCMSWKLFWPDGTLLPLHMCPMAIALKENRPIRDVELIAERPDGERRWILPYPTPLRDAQDRIVGGVNMLVDITERQRAEEVHARLAAIVNSSDDAIIGKTLFGVITSWNRGAERIFGYTEAEAVGQDISLIIPLERRAEEAEILARLRSGERIDHFETERQAKDERRVPISLAVSPILDSHGRIIGVSTISRDITEQKLAAERLRELQKMESLGILAGGIAHDFNNLLTGVLGNASLLAESLKDSPEQRCAEALIEAGELMARLTQQMLAYSGKGCLVIEPVSLSHEVTRIAALIHASIPKHVTLQLSMVKELPAIEGDAGQIQQIIMNLVINGAEAIGPGGGTVEVSTSVEQLHPGSLRGNLLSENALPGAYVVLTVSDNGCGMDPETENKIFDPFFTTKFPGRGLGLSAVLGIVRSHKGLLTVTSSPGQGTTFKILFPVSVKASGAVVTGSPLDGRSRGGTILVVDDEEVVRHTAQTALRIAGYSVITAANGRDAVDVFQARHRDIHLIILDLTMPVIGGAETLLRLREIDPNVLVIGSSGYDETKAAPQFGTGVVAFLQKPYRADVLTDKVSRILQLRTAEAKREKSSIHGSGG